MYRRMFRNGLDITVNQTLLHRRVTRRIRSLPARWASRFINISMVEDRLFAAYEQAKSRYKAKLPKLPALDSEIVAGLERDGVFITSLDALGLPGSDEMFASGRKLADVYGERSARGGLRNQYTVQADADEVMRHSAIFRWGLNERLLRIAESYLGLPVGYDGINIFYTVADGRQSGARRWHRDIEDRRMLKAAVYFNDVDMDGGPLEILHRRFPGDDAMSSSGYPVLTQEALETKLGAPLDGGDVTTCVGPAGTVIFSDLATHYHRGRPAVSRDRCAVFYNYISHRPLRPFFCERSVLSRGQVAELVADLSPDQRACALWRDRLPRLARLVPPAPL